MTPDERHLVADLFDRLASLERTPRDPEAEDAIADGLARAPHAVYPLVQTVLVQEEALRQAQERIQALEAELGYGQPEPEREGSFLDDMRDTLFGRRPADVQPRGSVPSVRSGDAPMGTPPGFRAGAQPGALQRPEDGERGGSFLGTAAATAAGVVGGVLLMNSLGSLFGQGKAQAAYDGSAAGRDGSPWSDAAGSDLAREAGLNDIGRGGGDRPFGLFDSGHGSGDLDAPHDLDPDALDLGDFDIGGLGD